MKKIIAILLVAILATAFLASCSAGSEGAPNYGSGDTGSQGEVGYAPAASPSAAASYDPEAPQGAPPPMPSDGSAAYTSATSAQTGVVPGNVPIVGEGLSEKIIYSVYADIETVGFDDTIKKVYELLAQNGAFIESSYVGGRNYEQSYYGLQTYRSARFVLRIPKERLNAVTASLGNIGNVTSLQSDAQNITSQYIDTQARLTSYRTQEDRLLSMLAKADNVADMIEIEKRLADVRYDIESLTSTLNNWQNQVDYSTLTLNIQEVEKFTEIAPVQQRTYWQQIGDGLSARTAGVGRFFMDVFKWVSVNLPVLAILAVIVVAAVLIIRRRARRRKNGGGPQG